MTEVCLVGAEDVNIEYELLSRETSREALATYDRYAPFENTVAMETVSLGAAIALLNDLNWYLVRFSDAALVRDPSISEDEWLSRALATAVRDDEVDPAATGRFLKVYGVEPPDGDGTVAGDEEGSDDARDRDDDDRDGSDSGVGSTPERDDPSSSARPHLVEPMLVTRTGDDIPEYDLRPVTDTVVVRVTEAEFGA